MSYKCSDKKVHMGIPSFPLCCLSVKAGVESTTLQVWIQICVQIGTHFSRISVTWNEFYYTELHLNSYISSLYCMCHIRKDFAGHGKYNGILWILVLKFKRFHYIYHKQNSFLHDSYNSDANEVATDVASEALFTILLSPS